MKLQASTSMSWCRYLRVGGSAGNSRVNSSIDAGHPIEDRHAWSPLHESFEQNMLKYRRKSGVGEFGKEETAALVNLMRQMSNFRPEERLTVEEVLHLE
ncbi:hypothetical protein BJX76DRAFT_333592 [Aspergillus varians]